MPPVLTDRSVAVDLVMVEGSVFDPVFSLLDEAGELVPLEALTTARIAARAAASLKASSWRGKVTLSV